MKRDQRIRSNLRRHAELMAKYEAEGLTREAASKRAFKEITSKN